MAVVNVEISVIVTAQQQPQPRQQNNHNCSWVETTHHQHRDSKLHDRAKLRKQNLLVYIRRPEKSFLTPLQPQKLPIRAQKRQNYPKIKSKSNVRIEDNI